MAPIGQIYGYVGHFKVDRALAAAAYNGLELEVVETKALAGDTKKPEFLAQFPYGKIPAFKGSDGFVLTEGKAIARYVAGLSDNAKLLGTDAKSAALVEQWISFADDEILAPALQIFLLCKGIIAYNKAAEQKSWESLDRAFTFVEAELKKKTFLVGHRVTLADLTLAADLKFVLGNVAGVNFRSKYPNTVRYFNTVTKQPQVLSVFKEVTFAEDNVKFTPPKKEEKPKAAPAPKAEKPKAAAAPAADDDDDEPKPAPKPKNPLDDLPKSSFNLDEWKRTYSNEETRETALPWFFKNFDAEGYSISKLDYKYNDELQAVFQSNNLIGGFFARLEASRKYTMGTLGVFGENNNNLITGVLITRGKDPKSVLEVAPDFDSYAVTPLDISKPEDKKFFEDMMAWEAVVDGKAFADGKVMK
ncbi:related to translation elongation factor eEF1, gamma chain [Sporisorium reilianum SRZ2]|uniref:Related to translation elongation factor eEF1, gamma chain n=1 Tax=Sporisorium reilianum (strain SRZ2) TaxID=999809 RepID=E6ZVC8_SPORE|nr:related to translation elongation factor eEF1, gamma chain [Sporisorium reilianum SRZ2]